MSRSVGLEVTEVGGDAPQAEGVRAREPVVAGKLRRLAENFECRRRLGPVQRGAQGLRAMRPTSP